MLKAMLFREQKNWEQSIQHFEKSLQGYKSLNAQKWYVCQFAELLYEYGLMYLDRNQEGDKEKAYSLLDQALEIYQKMDAKKKIEKIIAKKKLSDADWADWTKTPKYSAEEIVKAVRKEKLPILSVHASRDVGNYLCSKQEKDRKKGKRVIYDSLSIAEDLGARVCVFHLWNTWKTDFDLDRIKSLFSEVTSQFSRVKASVENIPTHLIGNSPFSLVSSFDYVTLDLRWAALYGEFDAFERIADSVVNVHLRGKLENDRWVLDRSSFGFYEALDKIRNDWKYEGLLTMEPEGKIDAALMGSFFKAMRSLRQ